MGKRLGDKTRDNTKCMLEVNGIRLIDRTLEHLQEKYGDGGYLRLWIPESPNAGRLEELRKLIRDPESLRSIFEQIFAEERVTA